MLHCRFKHTVSSKNKVKIITIINITMIDVKLEGYQPTFLEVGFKCALTISFLNNTITIHFSITHIEQSY